MIAKGRRWYLGTIAVLALAGCGNLASGYSLQRQSMPTKYGYFTFDFEQRILSNIFWQGRSETLENCSNQAFSCVKSTTISFILPRSCDVIAQVAKGTTWTFNGITTEVLDVRYDYLAIHGDNRNGIYFINSNVPDVVYQFQFRHQGEPGVLLRFYTDTAVRLAQRGEIPFSELARSRELSSDRVTFSSDESFDSLHSLDQRSPVDPVFSCQ